MKQPLSDSGGTSPQTLRNIRAICELERKALESRTTSERASDFIASHAGRVWFTAVHLIVFVVWVAWNSGLAPSLRRFDPFPYPALTAAVSLETICLTLILIMSQNRATRQADAWAHLSLQINLLAEHETTKVLSMLKALCAHHRLPEGKDPELAELLQKVEPAELAHELEQRLPAGGTPSAGRPVDEPLQNT